MNSVVCISHVPDTESRIKVSGAKVDETGLKFIVSPYDEYALEEAIRLKEKSGGDVTVLTFGPERAQQALRELREWCPQVGCVELEAPKPCRHHADDLERRPADDHRTSQHIRVTVEASAGHGTA